MKKYIFIISFALFINKVQSQSWQWAISCGKSAGDDFGRLAIDNNSNLYLAGIFYSPYGYFGTDTFLTNGNSDLVLAKLNSSGNFQWTRQIGKSGVEGVGQTNFNSATNSVFFDGNFEDSITLGTNTLISAGNRDIFISKYDVNGNCQWAKKAGGNALDYPIRIDSDINGNLYAIGIVMSDTAYFDSYMITGGGYFLAKYDNNGTCQWAQKKLLAGVNIYSTSCYNNEIMLAGGTTNDTVIVETDTLFSNGSGGDLLLAKFDSNGNLIWAKLDGGGTVYIAPIAKYDNSGNIYVTGNLSGNDTSVFGSIIFPPVGPGPEIFLVKYDNGGSVIWAKESTSSYDCVVQDLSVNMGDGSCYLTGRFQDTLTLGNYTVSGASFIEEHMFIARYDANGDCQGIRHTQVDVDGPYPGGGYSVVQDANAVCYVAGQFSNTANFDTYSITSVWQKDIFIAKIDAITGIGGREINPNNQLIIYANPTTGKCNVTIPDEFQHEKNLMLSIYNNSGKLIQQLPVQMMEEKIKLNLEAEAKGIYNVTLSNGKKSYGGKIVFE